MLGFCDEAAEHSSHPSLQLFLALQPFWVLLLCAASRADLSSLTNSAEKRRSESRGRLAT
eukprot:3899327-Rhodomonas_salina.1